MTKKYLDYDYIYAQADGKYTSIIFPFVGITFRGNGKQHQPCPVCGGNDRFRCDDKNGSGSSICTNCGARNGYQLVRDFTGKDHYATMATIAQALNIDGGKQLTDAERQDFAQQHAQKKAESEAKANAEKRAARLQASKTAQTKWAKATKANPAHPYLLKKDIIAINIKQLNDSLLVPMHYYNWDTGVTTLVNVQSIDADGNKRFEKGGLKKGCYCALGDSSLYEQSAIILVCEGYATAVTVSESMDYQLPVIVAFDAGNLLPVCQSICHQYPHYRIIICADNDIATQAKIGNNPGIDKAQHACKQLGIEMVFPVFERIENKDVA